MTDDTGKIKNEVSAIREHIRAQMRNRLPTSWEYWYRSRTLLDFQHKREDDRQQLLVVLARSIAHAEGNLRWAMYHVPREIAACQQQRAFYCDIFELLVAPHPLQAIDPCDGCLHPLSCIILRLTHHFWYEPGQVAVWLRTQGY